ncbi:hypothetical protein [Nonomuraea sp. NPDC005650]|uniref:hypothetical protein n=1 Tax=Nonomuraea sp. NPDC005650 TaxID=3157045 RepID=UPI0033A9E4C5
MSFQDDVGDDLPSDEMVQNWEEANAHADETPHDDEWPDAPNDNDNVAQLLDRQLDRLAATLHDSVARLDEHIERRAAQLAAPRIAAAERRATEAEQRADKAAADWDQRLEDLRQELVRQLESETRRTDRLLWLSRHLPEPLRPLAGSGVREIWNGIRR